MPEPFHVRIDPYITDLPNFVKWLVTSVAVAGTVVIGGAIIGAVVVSDRARGR